MDFWQMNYEIIIYHCINLIKYIFSRVSSENFEISLASGSTIRNSKLAFPNCHSSKPANNDNYNYIFMALTFELGLSLQHLRQQKQLTAPPRTINQMVTTKTTNPMKVMTASEAIHTAKIFYNRMTQMTHANACYTP